MRREFDIAAPDLRLVWLVPGIVLLACGIGVAFAARQEPKALLALPAVALSVALIALLVKRRKALLEDGQLTIVAGLNRLKVRVADLDLAGARIVNLADAPELRPWIKVFGTSTPGYRAGHFRLRDRSKAFVLLTDRGKVLALPERGGRTLLLSAQRPQSLLDALRAVTDAPSRR